MNDKVWALTIEHRHGSNVSVHRTEQGALDALAGYVAEWWGDTGIADIPSDDLTAIDDYFEHVGDESYSLEMTELLP